jgi:hypothetical protein
MCLVRRPASFWASAHPSVSMFSPSTRVKMAEAMWDYFEFLHRAPREERVAKIGARLLYPLRFLELESLRGTTRQSLNQATHGHVSEGVPFVFDGCARRRAQARQRRELSPERKGRSPAQDARAGQAHS